MEKLFIGIDLHKHQFTVYFMSENGKGDYGKYSTDEKGYAVFLEILKRFKTEEYGIWLGVESTGNTRFFIKQVKLFCEKIKIVNTMKFKVINESVNKTDKRDAKTIAEFLRKDMLPESILSSEESERMKRLLQSRATLVQTRTKLKNQIHGILLSYGITTKNGQLNSKKGRNAVIECVRAIDTYQLIKTMINAIDKLDESIKEIEKKLEELSEDDPSVKILKSIPGTGKINALTVRAYIDEIKRFKHYKKLSAYAGLVPWVQCSDKKEYYGHITKRGPSELRTALIQMVLGMVRMKDEKDNVFMQRYRFLKKRKGSGKALVALARKMSKLVWTLLTNNDEYNRDKMNSPVLINTALSMQKAALESKENAA